MYPLAEFITPTGVQGTGAIGADVNVTVVPTGAVTGVAGTGSRCWHGNFQTIHGAIVPKHRIGRAA